MITNGVLSFFPASCDTPSTDTEPSPPDAPAKFKRKSKNRRPEISDTVPAIPVSAFQRLVREITNNIKSDLRWEAKALEALQVDSEAFLIQHFDEANKRRKLAKVKTLDPKHFQGIVARA